LIHLTILIDPSDGPYNLPEDPRFDISEDPLDLSKGPLE
jgi:hypothetical protein